MKLGKVCFLKSGKNVTAKDIYDKPDVGLFPCYGGNGLRGYVDKFNYDGKYNLIGRQGALCGNINRATGRFYATEHAVVVTPLIPLDDDWLYYALVGMNLNQYHTGAAQPGLNIDILNNVEINVPSLAVQRYQAIILNKVSEIITSRKQELRLLDDLIKARFVEMFGDESNKKVMNEVCSIITDGTHQPPKFVNNGIPFIFVSNITGNKIVYEAEKFIDQNTYDELVKRTPIKIGDVLLSTVGSYGHAAVVKTDKKFLFQRHIAYLKPRKDLIDSDYLHGAILSPNFQQQIEESVKGIAQKTLNLSEIKKMTIPVPALSKQKEFAAFVTQVDKTKAAVQKALDEAQLLFDSLMQQYFG